MPSRPARVAATSVAAIVTLCASVAVAVPALAGTTGAAATTPAWLQRVNDVRVAAGVGTVTENSAWTLGIQHHLTYLELTPSSYRTGQYASAHTENPDSPYYTADGALEGSRSNLVRNASQTATSAVDYWFGAPFHAIGMLRAGLTRTAFAQDSTYAGMDVISGYSSTIRSATPILFPGPGSTSYLTAYAGNESPDPIETCRKANPGADYSAPGLPLIAMLPAAPATSLTASLTTPSGTVLSSKTADLCIVDENTYSSSDTVYGPTGKQILTTDHAVLLVPRTRLVAGTYTARISQSKQADIAWSFRVDPTAKPSSAPTSAPTTTAPTTTSTTTAATSAATSTAPTSSAPTSSAPTSSAPTSSAPTSSATSGTTAPPVAEAPEVATSDVACSYGARATGSASLSVRNPADGAGTSTYSVVVGTRGTATGAVPDGTEASVTVTGLSGGSSPGSVSGSDGTSAVFGVSVPTCPRYQGVRVGIRKVASHRLRVRLDNSRNSGATVFRVVVGHDSSRHRVAAQAVDRVRAPLHGVTRVQVYVGEHRVARARLRP